MNLTVELTTDQVVGFVQQMPAEERRALLLAIAEQAAANREARIDRAETHSYGSYVWIGGWIGIRDDRNGARKLC